ncbi:nuclear receptor-binding protein [Anopheles darlingi]|uniref:Nuclear receptor-binding protein homolog n=1 Tax=Anopheles darlingi TaxID=43151 RepID=A0A2M4CTL3_ANODA|nr:nuclear receptor-binding protein [Anopheles darlingi]XP_049538189.1 nuclear receptor-binding protein [Anopheles darlingi]XP_049538190.1 nuclear receptor-binding protein [Anopheles darlingi]XP_049538191.1 nuclear receptor-binding protein [Anopheles darlingi]XP_049538192.1 nuclear receptor-binding protein [Anopheles darlingi]XP_049538193.1 nuclear receptor-binding protein [Anopheles darlingi]XP_049538195.1 nuclear receptor-binding protein [Anopheles darlingi]
MPGSRSSNNDTEHNRSPRESGEDSEDESEILEESPCGRWLKRKEEVEQRDVPGIDCAHLAMDTEEGVEVVWNEVQFSERKNFKSQEEKIQLVFENLTQLEHPNIVKFHRYWTDTHNDKPRVIFITEYMSSGSLKQFLKRTKKNVKKLPLQAWKRWCTQILSALSYLHSCSPPVIHGNLTCDTIFIQHNGLVKIGSVAPDAIHHHVKTCRDNMKNMHFIAPEYGSAASTTAIDVYSFGICALEMAALEIQGNGDSGTLVTDEHIKRTVESLEDAQQKDFINKCLSHDPAKRPSARELLFHPLLFEVHALKLLAAHCLVNTSSNYDEMLQKLYKPEVVYAEIRKVSETFEYHLGDIVGTEKLEKFVEDVKYGIYPLTAFSAQKPPATRPRAISPETAESVKSATPEPLDIETRKVVNMICSVKPREENCELFMTILLRMDDKMNRQLTCPISADDSAVTLSHELVHLGFIHEIDREKIATMIEDTLRNHQQKMHGTSKIPSATALTSAGSVTGDLGVAIGSMSDPLTAASSSASSLSAKANHLHHHVPVHSASLERGWKVADTESILATMPAIMETSGISVNSMMDGALFGVHLDDAEEARENDEELEALEEMVAQRRRSSQRMAQCEAVDSASSSPPAMYHRQSMSGGGGGAVQQDPSSSLLMMMVNSNSPSGGGDTGELDHVEQPAGDPNESYEATD